MANEPKVSAARKAAEQIYGPRIYPMNADPTKICAYRVNYSQEEAEHLIEAACSQPVAPGPEPIPSLWRIDKCKRHEDYVESCAGCEEEILTVKTEQAYRAGYKAAPAGAVSTPRCPKCKVATSLMLRDYEDGWRLSCGANCGFSIAPTDGLEFPLASFTQFFQPVSQPSPAKLAQRFHEAYERLAPQFGYETRQESAKPWADVPESNKRLMIAVCAEILGGK